jgi:hypothetical protein
MRTTATFPHLACLALLLASGCEQSLNFGEENHGGDHVLAFVGGVDSLGAPDAAGWQSTGVLYEDKGFSRLGLRYDASSVVTVEARFRAMGEELVGEWLPGVLTFEEQGAHNAYLDAPFVADAAELRFFAPVEAQLSFAAVELFDRMAGASGQEEELEMEATGTLEQGLAANGLVVTRSQWSARTRNCSSTHTPNRITIHHTVTPNNDSLTMAARMRQIQAYHIDVRGYCDIGYHFLIGQDGLIYQGRPETRVGAHALNANTRNAGVSFIGDYSNVDPTPAQKSAAARIMRSLLATYGIAANRSTVKGHREVGGTATACPGQRLFNRLQELIDLTATVGSAPLSTGGGAGVTPDLSQPSCNSSTLGRTVEHGSCVQVTYAGCGSGTCGWYTCHAGSWQCVNRDSCDDEASFANASCPGSATTSTINPPPQDAPPPANNAQPQSYGDLPPSHPAFAAAEALRSVGAMWGCAAGQFCPDQPVSRAEVAHLFDRLLVGDPPMPSSPSFDDVTTNHWFFEAVQRLAARGVTTGCGPRKFCPWDGVTKAVIAVFLGRAEGVPLVTPAVPTFLDVGAGHWAYEFIEGAYAEGLVDGCSATLAQFCPSDLLTRADAARLFARIYLQ